MYAALRPLWWPSALRSLCLRHFSSESDSSAYIEQWQVSTTKPQSFYDEVSLGLPLSCHIPYASNDEDLAAAARHTYTYTHTQNAAGTPPTYFYHVDLQGRLFLEDVNPKNIATSLKSNKFLDFFFRRLKRLPGSSPAHVAPPGFDDYGFISPCQGERNYVRPADQPIVFHTFEGSELVWGGTLTQAFEPSKLAYR